MAEDTTRSGDQRPSNHELTATELYSQSAVYVAAAHALKPEYPVSKIPSIFVNKTMKLCSMALRYIILNDLCYFLQVYKSALRLVRSKVRSELLDRAS